MITAVFQRALELLRQNRRFAILHLVRIKGSSPGKQGFKLLLTPQGEQIGTIGGGDAEFKMLAQAREALAEGRSRTVQYDLTNRPGNLVQSLCGGQNELFIEVFMEKPCLLLLGAGHVSRAVGKLCAMLEYPYVVVDDRPEWAVASEFPGALEIACMRPAEYFKRTDLPLFSHVYGLGRDAEFDLEGLCAGLGVLAASTRFGAIGSKAKFARMTEMALQRGVQREQWSQVKSPVGLDIGARTPAEIAVALAAEVIATSQGAART